MSNLIDNRQIRIFISSTFRDMQDERDYLMKRTFPKLRKLAAERDVTLTELDLRWGITEEESKSGKVVEICLREIENSIPFFIGIIGNRYGWVPEKKDLDGKVTERFNVVNDYLERHLSVTEMEMQFGVLAREEDMHAYFYIKEQEEKDGQDNPEMLQRLKEEVKASKYPSFTYNSSEDLARQVETAFTNLLNQLFPENHISEYEKECIAQRAFMNQLCQNYVRDDKNFEELDKWFDDENQHQLVITGASGLGKSALVAKWLKEKLGEKELEYNIVYHFTGNGGSESTKEHVAKAIVEGIYHAYGWGEPEEKSKYKIEDAFGKVQVSEDKPLLVVIDAINQIIDYDNAKLLNWFPVVSKKIKVLFTTLEDDPTMDVFQNRHYPVFTLAPFDLERRKLLVKNYLHSFAKKLTEKQVDRIASDRQCENTLVLRTLLDELINFGIYEELDNRIDYYLSQNTIEDFYQNLLQRYEEDYGYEFVKHTLSLIVVAKEGLQEPLIQEIVKAPALVWSQLYCSFINNFVVKNGKLNFSHSYIRSAVFNRYLKGDKKWENDCRHEILSYTQLCKDTFFERPYQLYMIQDEVTLDALYKDMSAPEVTATIYRCEKINCINYWRILIARGYDMHILAENDFYKMDLEKDQEMIFQLTSLADLFGDNMLACKLTEKQFKVITNTPNVSKDLFIRSCNAYAQALARSNDDEDFHKAIEYYFKAYEVVDNTSSKELAVTYNGLAQCCVDANRNDEAIILGEKALEINKKYYGESHHEIAVNLNVIAQAYEKQGNYAKAIEAYAKSINILILIYGNRYTDLCLPYYNLADCQYKNQEYSLALQNISKAIEIIETTFGKDYYDIDSYIQLKNDILSSIEAQKLNK